MSLSLGIMEDREITEALKNVLDIVEMEQEREYVSNAELFDQLLTAFSSELTSQLVPTEVAKDYTGVHLGQMYEDNDLKQLLNSFKISQTLDPFYSMRILNDAKEKFRTLPNIRECVLDDPKESGCIVVGDLHGNFNDLYHLIDKYGIPGAEYKFIFNGDFVDRGNKQIEVVLSILYAFLIRPHRVFLNRGNHEDISLNSSNHFSPNLMNDTRNSYGKYGSVIYSSANELFSYLPLATILKNNLANTKYFIVHGGISDIVDLDFLKNQVNRFKFKRISYNPTTENNLENKMVSDLLWSDPIRNENGKIRPKCAPKLTGCYFNSTRNLGSVFGVDVTEKFCRKYSFNALIRSHEVRDKGYSEDHLRCYTIFSASYYCGGSNFGSVFKFNPKESAFEAYSYKNVASDFSSLIVKKNHMLIRQFKKLIQANQSSLLPKFESLDPKKKGFIKTNDWANILAKQFNNEISVRNLNSLKDLLCECENTVDLVNYKTLFPNSNGQIKLGSSQDGNMLNVIRNLFDILDKNNDKKISISEAKDALAHVNHRLGNKYSVLEDCVNFIKNMDRNGDNVVDLDEFTKAFLGEESHEHNATEDHINSEHSDNDDDIQIVRL